VTGVKVSVTNNIDTTAMDLNRLLLPITLTKFSLRWDFFVTVLSSSLLLYV
jgi:hypothetical protein